MRKCIVCGADLYEKPLLHCENFPASAQGMPRKDELNKEKGIDLNLCQCTGCGLIQFDCDPVDYYRDVIRAGGFTTTMTELRRTQYRHFIETYGLQHKKFIEVGCGRGEFLTVLKEFPVDIYGIEHDPELVDIARKSGLNVECAFAENAETVLSGAPFDVFLSFNFLEHQPDPNGMIACISRNLVEGGYGLITVPSWEYILEHGGYYELLRDHIAYYSQKTLRFLMEKNGFDVLETSTVNRDTIQMIVRKRLPEDVEKLRSGYERLKGELQAFVDEQVSFGKKIAVWGAGHQALTALSSMGIGEKMAYIIDSAPFKQGKYSPASHLPIVSPEHFFSDPVQVILIAAPGYTDEIAGLIKERFGQQVLIATLRDGIFCPDIAHGGKDGMRKIVITGATGFLGSELVKLCLKNGDRVYAIIRKNSKHIGNLVKHENLTVIECEREKWATYVPDVNDCDVFYHFAWETERGTHDDLPLQVQNIRYALDAVELAKRFGCHTFIGAGSQAEYGRVEGELRPDTPAFPDNGYGIAKLCAGQMTRERAHQLGIQHVWVRIVSVYGPYDGPQSMISSTIKKLLAGERAPFTKGEQMWDYLYSADAAEAFYQIGERGKDGKTYVLGNGTARPLAEYIRLIGRACGAEDKIDLGAVPYAERQVMCLKADISELTKDTGWRPQTTFEEGIKMTVKAFKTLEK